MSVPRCLIRMPAALLLAATLAPTVSLTAQDEIPEGSTIDSATFSVFMLYPRVPPVTINAHRITAAWTEMGVTWNNFGSAYDAAVEGSFLADTLGEYEAMDLTALVQDWVDGTHPNYGILLEQGDFEFTQLRSREELEYGWPILEIWYTPPGGESTRLELLASMDSYIREIDPDENFGAYQLLNCGVSEGYEKLPLFYFDIATKPPEPEGPGTGTPGYWKNHPEAWPVDEITIGGVTYTKAQAIALIGAPEKGDKSFNMFRHLACAMLNVEIGNASSCIDDYIADGNDWVALHPPGSKVKGNSDAWDVGEPIADMLDDYNNGLLCAPHRDS